LDIDTGVLSIIDQSSRAGTKLYCLYAGSRVTILYICPLIPENDEKEIAARKAVPPVSIDERPSRLATGIIYQNVPYPGDVIPPTVDTEEHEQSNT
jgi:hypothetical protein